MKADLWVVLQLQRLGTVSWDFFPSKTDLTCALTTRLRFSCFTLLLNRYHSVLSLLNCTLGSLSVWEFRIVDAFNVWYLHFFNILPELLREISNEDCIANVHDILLFLPTFVPVFLRSLALMNELVIKFKLINFSFLNSLCYLWFTSWWSVTDTLTSELGSQYPWSGLMR